MRRLWELHRGELVTFVKEIDVIWKESDRIGWWP